MEPSTYKTICNEISNLNKALSQKGQKPSQNALLVKHKIMYGTLKQCVVSCYTNWELVTKKNFVFVQEPLYKSN